MIGPGRSVAGWETEWQLQGLCGPKTARAVLTSCLPCPAGDVSLLRQEPHRTSDGVQKGGSALIALLVLPRHLRLHQRPTLTAGTPRRRRLTVGHHHNKGARHSDAIAGPEPHRS